MNAADVRATYSRLAASVSFDGTTWLIHPIVARMVSTRDGVTLKRWFGWSRYRRRYANRGQR